MTRTTRASTIWWHPAEHDARRLWTDALRRAGVERSRPIAAFVAAGARLRLDEQQVAATAGLPASWLVQPTPTRRRRGAPPMIPDERRADLQRFLDDLTALTRQYGFELASHPTNGLSVRDQEHDAVLARDGELDSDGVGYRFEVVGDVTAKAYLRGDEGT